MGEAALPLRQNREFVAVLAGQAVSALGDAVTITALPLLVLATTGSGALMGVVGALQLVPDLLLGLLAGALADRWDRRRLMFWADAGRALLTAAIPVAAWLDVAAMPVVLVVAAPIGALRVPSDGAFTAALPQLVGREQYPKAAGYLEATLSVPFVVGPALAGVLVVTLGAAETLALDAASFAVSAGSVLLVRRELRAPRDGAPTSIRADVGEGIRFLRGDAVLRRAVGFGIVLGSVASALLPALGYYVISDRDLGAGTFGLVGSAWSVGYLVASLLVGRFVPRRPTLRMSAAAGALAVGIAAIVLSSNRVVLVVGAATIGAGVAVGLLSYLVLRTARTPDSLLGRVGGAARALTMGLQPVGLLGVGLLLEATDGRTALLALAGSAAVTAFVLVPRRAAT